MNRMQELREKAKAKQGYSSGPRGGGNNGPKVGEGTWKCLLTKAECGKGNNGATRGLLELKALDGQLATSNTTSLQAQIGGTFNKYIQTSNEEYLTESLEELSKILIDIGVPEDKIFDDDCQNDIEILVHLLGLFQKQIARGKDIILIIERKEQSASAPNGTPYYYNDIVEVLAPAAIPTADDINAAVDAMVEEAVNAPATTAPATTTEKKKPWAK